MTEIEIYELKLKLLPQMQEAIKNIVDGIYQKNNDQTVNGITGAYEILDNMEKELIKLVSTEE